MKTSLAWLVAFAAMVAAAAPLLAADPPTGSTAAVPAGSPANPPGSSPAIPGGASPMLPTGVTPNIAIELLGRGVQIYSCGADGSAAPSWRLKTPEATLRDPSGRVAAMHFAGPSWQARDGSKIVGQPVVYSSAPRAGAIPWVVLRVVQHDGAGAFADVSYVTRTDTIGGMPPAVGCDASHLNAEVRVPYTATYTFFVAPPS